MTPEKLLQAQQELKARMAKSQWKLWANAGELQQRRTDAKRRKSKKKWWRTHLSAAANKSAARRAERERIEKNKTDRLERKRLKLEKKEARRKALLRKLRDPIAERARIWQEGYFMGQRNITESGLWIKKS